MEKHGTVEERRKGYDPSACCRTEMHTQDCYLSPFLRTTQRFCFFFFLLTVKLKENIHGTPSVDLIQSMVFRFETSALNPPFCLKER